MKTGKTVKIVHDPIAPVLNGLIGKIISIRESRLHPGTFLYQVRAENWGPYMWAEGVQKKVHAWKKGDTRKVPAEALQAIDD